MKKVFLALMAAIMILSLFSGCKPGENVEPSPSVPALTDFNTSEAQQHEAILPWPWAEGESADNRYYKRTTDSDGTAVYAVMQASNNQVAYLPMGSTVVYTGQYETSYYEKFTITYKEDGVDKSMVQYQLYVGTGNVDPNTVETMAPAEPTDTIVESGEPEVTDGNTETTDTPEESGEVVESDAPEGENTDAPEE